jgi:hypothetical protein
MCYGYRVGEVITPQIEEVKKCLKISEPREVDTSFRPTVAVSLGCNLERVALPHADPHSPSTMVAGVKKRAGRATPVPKPGERLKLRQFVRKKLETFERIDIDADLSLETWLSHTNYSEERKDELRRCWANFTSVDDPEKRYKQVKAFMKDEVYPEIKMPRGIYARSDEFKCLIGPIVKHMESLVYKNHHFIKHVPVSERAKYITDLLYAPGATYGATDYTSFEALFDRELMQCVEFELYDYMTANLAQNTEFMRLCDTVLAGENEIKFRDFIVSILATRMSGEMVTSLGNGFSNLMFMLYECEKLGNTITEGVVEGDDGLFVTNGPFPTAADFAELGLIIKIELHSELHTASFCGQVFDPEDQLNVTDVRKVLATFGWTTRQYARSGKGKLMILLRSKALSIGYQYPGCPILGSLAKYALRVTKSYDVRGYVYRRGGIDTYTREMLIKAYIAGIPCFKEPPIRTRLLVERLYGVSVETQLRVEKQLDAMADLQQLDFPLITDALPSIWTEYFDKYALFVDYRGDINYPGLSCEKLSKCVN